MTHVGGQLCLCILNLCLPTQVEEMVSVAVKRGHASLNLSHQNLTVAPSSLSQLAAILKQLYLNNNKLIIPPAEVK